MSELYWRTEKRKVNDLKLFEGNPRKITKKQAEQLLESLKKFNLVEIPVIDQNNRVIAGNMRIMALKKLGRGDEEIEVRVPSRPLTEDEAREYLLRSNRNVGEWDFKLLSAFDQALLEMVGFSDTEIAKTFRIEEKLYSRKVETLVYTPRGEKYEPKDLYDDSKQKELAKMIEEVEMDEELKRFLLVNTYRHVVYDFRKIAEFYSQLTDEKIKRLFEESALVIVDYNMAIERGWAKLHEEFLEQIEDEYGKE